MPYYRLVKSRRYSCRQHVCASINPPSQPYLKAHLTHTSYPLPYPSLPHSNVLLPYLVTLLCLIYMSYPLPGCTHSCHATCTCLPFSASASAAAKAAAMPSTYDAFWPDSPHPRSASVLHLSTSAGTKTRGFPSPAWRGLAHAFFTACFCAAHEHVRGGQDLWFPFTCVERVGTCLSVGNCCNYTQARLQAPRPLLSLHLRGNTRAALDSPFQVMAVVLIVAVVSL